MILGLSYSVPADHGRDKESELEADKRGDISIAYGCLSSCSKQSRALDGAALLSLIVTQAANGSWLAAVPEKSTSFQEGKRAVSGLDAQERHVQRQKRQLFKAQGPLGPTGSGCTLASWLLIYKAAALRLQRTGFLSLSIANLWVPKVRANVPTVGYLSIP